MKHRAMTGGEGNRDGRRSKIEVGIAHLLNDNVKPDWHSLARGTPINLLPELAFLPWLVARFVKDPPHTPSSRLAGRRPCLSLLPAAARCARLYLQSSLLALFATLTPFEPALGAALRPVVHVNLVKSRQQPSTTSFLEQNSHSTFELGIADLKVST